MVYRDDTYSLFFIYEILQLFYIIYLWDITSIAKYCNFKVYNSISVYTCIYILLNLLTIITMCIEVEITIGRVIGGFIR